MDSTECPACNSLDIPRWFVTSKGLIAKWEKEDGTYVDLTTEEVEYWLKELQ